MVTIEDNVCIGEGASIDGGAFFPTDKLVLGKVHIKKGAVIGDQAVVGPWVVVGEYAVVKAMSLIPMFTEIRPYEIWAGNPAKKTGEVATSFQHT